MGRGSGADTVSMASTRKPVSAITNSRVSEKEETTLGVLANLEREKPGEAIGFGLRDIAEAGLPEMSPKEREGYYRVIAQTADSLVEKGLAECNIDEQAEDFQWEDVRWRITPNGTELLSLALALSASSKIIAGDLGAS
jgi:hypothetical protein